MTVIVVVTGVVMVFNCCSCFVSSACLGKQPELKIIPENIVKAVGQGVYVSCMADVDDTALVTEMSWTAPDGRRITNNVDDT